MRTLPFHLLPVPQCDGNMQRLFGEGGQKKILMTKGVCHNNETTVSRRLSRVSRGALGKHVYPSLNQVLREADAQFSGTSQENRKEVAVLQLHDNTRLVLILIIPPLEYFASEDRTTATGKYFLNSPWQNGDFLGIASVSFRRRTPLCLGHCSTATDGTSITVNHTTWVDLAKSVVAVIGAWLLFSTQQRKRQPNSGFLIKSLRHKSPFIKQLRNKIWLWHRILGNLASSCQLNSLLKRWKDPSSRLQTIFLCVSCCSCHIFHIWLFCRKRDVKEKIFSSYSQHLLFPLSSSPFVFFPHVSCFRVLKLKRSASFLQLLFFFHLSFVSKNSPLFPIFPSF